MEAKSVAAILLAAGESRRMGSPKPLLPWLGTTLVAHQVEQLVLAGARPVVVVLGHAAAEVAAAIGDRPGVALATNPAYQQGKTTSIRVGAKALPVDVDSILVLAVDQPRRAETMRHLICAHREGRHLITVASYQGRRGHPVVLNASLRAELERVSEERQGLREILERHRAAVVDVPTGAPEVLVDINTPESYREALGLYAALVDG